MVKYISFLLQSTRVLENGSYTKVDLDMIYDFIVSVDEKILDEYSNSNMVLVYMSDLELYLEIVDKLIEIFEKKEEYEKCSKLRIKREKSINIIKKE